jgi:ParB family chromosome partitioning protein
LPTSAEALAALVGPKPAPEPTAPVSMTVPIAWLRPGRFQPRTTFDSDRIAQLAESIRTHGLVQPLLVRPVPDAANQYEIVAGERRWRAAQQAQLHDVPVVVRSLDDSETLEIALIENLQRTDLTPIEEARAYRRLMDEFHHTQERMAEIIGKSRPHVANMLRLLELPASVQALIDQGRLDAGHGRALVGTPDPAVLADYVAAQGLSVRRAEALAAAAKEAHAAGWDGKGLPPAWSNTVTPAPAGAAPRRKSRDAAPAPAKTPETRSLERSLEEALGLKVSIDVVGPREETRLTILVDSFDQLDDVMERLTRQR